MQPIHTVRIKKPLQCLLTFSCCVCERKILQTVLLSSFFLFFSFYFLNALHSGTNSNTVYVLEHKINIYLTLLRVHFNPCLMAWAKMSLSGAHNMFMPANINLLCFIMGTFGLVSIYDLKEGRRINDIIDNFLHFFIV